MTYDAPKHGPHLINLCYLDNAMTKENSMDIENKVESHFTWFCYTNLRLSPTFGRCKKGATRTFVKASFQECSEEAILSMLKAKNGSKVCMSLL